MRVVIVLAVGLLVGGCVTAAGGMERSDPDELSRDEILSVEVSNLYQVVQRLRPRWISAERRAGERSFTRDANVVVYQGQTRLGTLEVLRDWSPSAAYHLQWLDGPRASATLPGIGTDQVVGAIVIRTRPED